MKRRHIYKLTPEQEEKENYIRSVRKMTNLAKELQLSKEEFLADVAKDWEELQKDSKL
jgi:hypothetical protein